MLPARAVPDGAGGRQRRELRRRGDGHASASSSRRATGACARPCRRVLVTIMGIEKLVPTFEDLEVFLQLLPRSSTGERMNPYTSLWTGVTPGDGPAGVPPGPARRRAHARARGRGRPPGAALHPLQRVPERLPGVFAHRRACLRLGLSRADRRDPDAAAAGDRARADAALRLDPLRRLLRGLPGHDRHPERAPAPARARPSRRPASAPRAGGDEDAPAGCSTALGASRSRSGSGASAQRPFLRGGDDPAPARTAGRLDAHARPASARAPRASANGGSGDGERLARADPGARPRRDRGLRARPPVPARVPSCGRARPRRNDRSAVRADRGLSRRGSPRRTPEDLRAAVGEAFAQRGARRVCVPVGDPRGTGAPTASSSSRTTSSSNAALDRLDGVLTGCTLAIAETGTIVLTGGSARGAASAQPGARPARLRDRGGAGRRTRAPGHGEARRPRAR